ncbi:hypothetical protein CWO89_25280 [Bradyrhizobium sp. Leo170]|nr:hypothetical protein CWO89_25280 [Bradyrhizobium sp. Leo170]
MPVIAPSEEKLLEKAKCQIAVYRCPGDLSAHPGPGIIAPRRSSGAYLHRLWRTAPGDDENYVYAIAL